MTCDVKITGAGLVRTIPLNRSEKKNALRDQLTYSGVEAIEAAARFDVAFGRDDGKEAPKAFFEKHKPNFTGR